MSGAILSAGFTLVCAVSCAAASWALLRRQFATTSAEMRAEAKSLRAEMDLLSVAVRKQEKEQWLVAPPPVGFHLNRRPDAVRRLRSSQPLQAIALSTGWTVPEVALLQKIEELCEMKRGEPKLAPG